MRTKTTSSDRTDRFSNQVHFNWGYHDAAHSLTEGWANPEHFWGFAKALGERITTPEDILKVHFDRYYAQGWLAGLRDAKAGSYTGNSLAAWTAFNA